MKVYEGKIADDYRNKFVETFVDCKSPIIKSVFRYFKNLRMGIAILDTCGIV